MKSQPITLRVGLSLALACTVLVLGACGGESSSPCTAERSLTILDPAEGQTLDSTRYTFLIRACGFARDDQIVLRILDPFPADYAFATLMTSDETVSLDVPVVPGSLRFQAASRDGSVSSGEVSVSGAPPE